MRRLLLVATLTAWVIVIASGCPDPPSTAGAEAITDRFCSAILTHDRPALRDLFGREAWNQAENLISLSPSTQAATCRKGRPLKTASGVTQDVFVSETDRRASRAARTVYALTIARVDRDTRITAIRVRSRFVAAGQGGWLMAGPERGPGRLVGLAQLPSAFTPLGAPSEVSFGVGRDRFGVLALTPNADQVAFFTPGVHSFLGKVTVRTRKVMGIDLFFEGSGEMLAFSPSGRFLAAEVMTPAGTARTTVYDLRSRRRAGPDLARRFPIESYHVRIESWDGQNRLHLRVNPSMGPPPRDIRQGDRWIMDIDSGEVARG